MKENQEFNVENVARFIEAMPEDGTFVISHGVSKREGGRYIRKLLATLSALSVSLGRPPLRFAKLAGDETFERFRAFFGPCLSESRPGFDARRLVEEISAL